MFKSPGEVQAAAGTDLPDASSKGVTKARVRQTLGKRKTGNKLLGPQTQSIETFLTETFNHTGQHFFLHWECPERKGPPIYGPPWPPSFTIAISLFVAPLLLIVPKWMHT
jgi:hypothetical protein